MSRSQEAELAEQAAIAGAKAMLTEIASGRSIVANRKSDFTFVLNLDLASDAAMRGVLKGASQNPIVSEEDTQSHSLLGSSSPYFLIDPLDGTNNCRRALEFFGPELRPMQENFGPIAGFVENGIIQCASFVSLTESLVWSAVRGAGCTVTPLVDKLTSFEKRQFVKSAPSPVLRECGGLFYPGKRGELELLN